MKKILVVGALISSTCVLAQRGDMTSSTGNVFHNGGGTTTTTPISITGSGKIMGIRVINSSSSTFRGGITVIIDGVTYTTSTVTNSYYYLQGSVWNSFGSASPTDFKGVEFQSGFQIQLSATTCTSCTTTAEVYYSLD